MLRRSAIVLGAFGLAAWGAGVSWATTYGITDLGCLATGTQSFAFAVNTAGNVAGYSYIAPIGASSPDPYHAFYGDGSLHDLGTLGGLRSIAYGINASRQVAGFAQIAVEGNPVGTSHAFVYSGGTMRDLTTVPGNLSATALSRAYAINSTGQAALFGTFADGIRGAFYDGTRVNELGCLPGGESQMNYAYGLNDSGQLVGACGTASGYRPTLYSGGSLYNLGTLGGSGDGSAQAINAGGRVAGFAPVSTTSNTHAFLWNPTTLNGTTGTMADLGTLGGTTSKAFGINSGGQVVGFSLLADTSQHAFLYDGVMRDLSTTALVPNLGGWTLTYAAAISDNGYICGYGTNAAGQTHGFLLTPTTATLLGDANNDGKVDIADLSILLTNFDKSGMGWSQGDFDHSGTVDIADLSNLLTNFDKTATASGNLKAVPEPGALALAVAALIGSLACTWRRASFN
jgi:probable HAF family extracellular repeat protein